MLELYLVRHGETVANREKRFQGWTESPLSEQGLWQAEKAGLFLGKMKIDSVYSSDLQRAVHTAEAIGQKCGLEPRSSFLLREINFGRWEGLTYDEIEAGWGEEIKSWFDDPFTRSAPGGENIEQVGQRMLSFLHGLENEQPAQQRLVVVSHGGSIRALLQAVMKLDREKFWNLQVDNASISLLCREHEQFRIVYNNYVEHLEVKPGEGYANGL